MKKKVTEVILVGLGSAGKRHLRAINFYEKRGKLRLVALVETSEKARAEFAALRKGLPVLPIAGSLPESPPADLVAIATPPTSHLDLALYAMEKGADVIVEKPMTLRVAEGKTMQDKSEQSGRCIIPCLTYRFYPGVQELKDFLTAGSFGRILSATATVRWGHDQAYYDQSNWLGTWEHEGGALMNQAIHALDLVFYLLGELPQDAVCRLAPPYHDIEAADLGMGVFSLDSGALVAIEGSTLTDPKQQEASIFLRYEKGTLSAGIKGGKISFSLTYDEKTKKSPRILRPALKRLIKRDGVGIIKHVGKAHTLLYGAVLDSQTACSDLPSAADGLSSLSLVLTLLEAAKRGHAVSYPSENFTLEDMKD
ncbi:MAG: Gfo/Idh/MocA family oxidoreductase [Saccharofermentanales bacterium]|jgi:predicted dehydrogenase|nr:Gfo/Idh/MocA family oxidoreductase [Eubacteriales bacterium]HHU04557.1 Gfo/Idh/MocA family oxidoreductase [Fastidiosipila sp.]